MAGDALTNSSQSDYLFSCQTGRDVFLLLMKEIRELNDFVVFQSLGQSTQRQLMQSVQVAEPANDPEQVEDDFDAEIDRFSEAAESYFYSLIDVPLQDVLLPAMAHVSLFALLTRALHLLNAEFARFEPEMPDAGSLRNCYGKQSELETLVSMLKKRTASDLELFSKHARKIDLVRRLRNRYMHGDWAGVRDLLRQLDIESSFRLVSDLFASLEESIHEPLAVLERSYVKRLA